MKCPTCSFVNPDDARFCENCGRPFEQTCPNCNQHVSPNAKFCRNCGFNLDKAQFNISQGKSERREPLGALRHAAPPNIQTKVAAARRSLEGERKLVTALFTDIVGSTNLAESMDPEDWREVVAGAHHRVGEAVYRYEGTIAQLLGDGVLAFFGAPIAHEDDSERAIRAALDILDSIHEYSGSLRSASRVHNLEMRVGLNTGLVVVGDIGYDMHMEYTAVGDTVNTAARMQSAAEPNTILISEQTYRFVKSIFSFEDRGRIGIKGKSEPLQVYRVLAERADAARVRGVEGLSSPIVGRDRELALLQKCAEDLISGRGQIVSIIGEAGLGKSRLAAEFQHRLSTQQLQTSAEEEARDTKSFHWLEGRSLSFQAATPFAPFVDMFTRSFELRSTQSDEEAYDQLTAQVSMVAPQFSITLSPFLATLLGIKLPSHIDDQVRYLEPPLLRERIFKSVTQFLELLANDKPVILQLEDLHWADATSLDLLEQLLPLTARVPLMLLALYRPQRLDPAWRYHEIVERDFSNRFCNITLDPLDESHSRELVGNLLYIEDLPETVRALILRKAEGNPFFVEEIIRSLLDAKLVIRENDHWRATREIANVAVPDTLAGVIASRLDRLDNEAKQVAQTAAVVGREFLIDILSDIYEAPDSLESALGTLERRELIREKAHLPKRNFSFRHALTQETAYASLLISRRRELHRMVAKCLTRISPERANDIAHHYLEAQEKIAALPYLIEAGNRASRSNSVPEASGFFGQAVDIAKTQSDLKLAKRAFEGLGDLLRFGFDIPGAIRIYHEMVEFAETHGDSAMQVSGINKLAFVTGLMMGQFTQAEEFLSRAEELAREVDDKTGLAEMFTIRCQICSAQADFDGTTHYMGEMLSIGHEMEALEQLAYGYAHMASAYANMAEYDKAYDTGRDAWKHVEQANARQHQAELYVFVDSQYHLSKGELDKAMISAQAGVEIAKRIGYVIAESAGRLVLATIARSRGEFELAIDQSLQAIKVAEPMAQMMVFLPALSLATLAATYVDISPRLNSLYESPMKEASNSLNTPMGVPGTAWVTSELGFARLALKDLGAARELIQRGLELPSMHRVIRKPVLLAGAAAIELTENKLMSAHSFLNQARDFVEGHMIRYLEPLIDLIDAQISIAEGDPKRGSEFLSNAKELAAEMNLRPLLFDILLVMGDKPGATRVAEEIKALFTQEELRSAFDVNSMRKLEGLE